MPEGCSEVLESPEEAVIEREPSSTEEDKRNLALIIEIDTKLAWELPGINLVFQEEDGLPSMPVPPWTRARQKNLHVLGLTETDKRLVS